MDEGLIRSIGVSNFSEARLEELIRDARKKPAVNQIESHPLLPNTELVRWCQSNGVAVTAYSPLAQGGKVFADETVVSIAAKHGVTPAQVLLRWNVERGVVVIPKSVTPARIAQNADVFGFGLDADDMRRMESLDADATTTPSPWSDDGPAARRNKSYEPLLSAVLRPFFWIVRVDVQRMGRKGFISWAWSRATRTSTERGASDCVFVHSFIIHSLAESFLPSLLRPLDEPRQRAKLRRQHQRCGALPRTPVPLPSRTRPPPRVVRDTPPPSPRKPARAPRRTRPQKVPVQSPRQSPRRSQRSPPSRTTPALTPHAVRGDRDARLAGTQTHGVQPRKQRLRRLVAAQQLAKKNLARHVDAILAL